MSDPKKKEYEPNREEETPLKKPEKEEIQPHKLPEERPGKAPSPEVPKRPRKIPNVPDIDA